MKSTQKHIFPDGYVIEIYESGRGHVTRPKNGEIGAFGFPIKNAQACLEAFQAGIRMVPPECKNW